MEWLTIESAQSISPAVLFFALLFGTWITEDLSCITGGLLVTGGLLTFPTAALACLVGIFTGDLLLYAAGRYLGRPFLHRRPLRWFVNEADIDRSTHWFERRGPIVVFAGRFVPGMRLPTYVAVGLLRMPIWRFSLFFLAAAIIWTPLLVGLAMILGRSFYAYFQEYQRFALLAFVLVALLIWLLVECVVPAFTHKGRRLLLSSWRRITRWEFWPPWFFYPPLLGYVLGLAIKHRSLTVFTASNPAMPAGGFIGESKFDILNDLREGRHHIARYALVRQPEALSKKVEQVASFMNETGLAYPMVLKPNTGQRGAGVAVIRSDEERDEYLQRAEWDTLVQEYAPGEEFGVFYYRYPDEERGRILSITEKQFPSVTGDGRRTLEELILDDDRAVCMARFYLRLHKDNLYDVPGDGERVPLVELGTHCRGALFLDGMWVNGPGLESALDEISKGYEGFYFGRYDIRTPDPEDLKEGRNFKIVELNGVTSEATHIYDPGNSLFSAYRTLFNQWRIAFEIGAANRVSGHPTTSPRELAHMLESFNRPEL